MDARPGGPVAVPIALLRNAHDGGRVVPTRARALGRSRSEGDRAQGSRHGAPMPLVLAALYSLLGAIVSDAVLELSLHTGLGWAPGNGIFVGMLVIWCVLLFLVGVTGRLRVAFTIVLTACLAIGAVNRVKMTILGEPVVPGDVEFVRSPGFLVDMVGVRSVVVAGVLVVLIGYTLLLVSGVAARRFTRPTRGTREWATRARLRAVMVVLCGALLWQTAYFNEPGNPWRGLYDGAGATWAQWSQAQNYQRNGFVGGFLYNLPTEVMQRPAGYSEDAMRAIARRYAERAEAHNLATGADPSAVGPNGYNVVLVLSESFADPTQLAGVSLSGDPIPRTRALMRSQWGGQTLTAFYGNGTSTMEYQALTGQPIALFEPQLTTPYQQLLPGLRDYPSAVGWFEQEGYKTVAIHAYSTELYRRPDVYRTFGFDDFVYDERMREQDKIEDSRFISDRSAYDEVIHQIRASGRPVFTHLVTMQNHSQDSGVYSDPMSASGGSDEWAEAFGEYATGLRHTDDALPGLLAGLRATGEPTVLLFFGDHYPGVLTPQMQAANTDLTLRTTPLFVWATSPADQRQLPVTNPIDFLPLLMERIDAPLTPYYELLREVAAVGAVDGGGVVDANGHLRAYTELTPDEAQLVHDLRMVQYDFSIGERYAVDDMWYGMEPGPAGR